LRRSGGGGRGKLASPMFNVIPSYVIILGKFNFSHIRWGFMAGGIFGTTLGITEEILNYLEWNSRNVVYEVIEKNETIDDEEEDDSVLMSRILNYI
jgi:hypothetical protein